MIGDSNLRAQLAANGYARVTAQFSEEVFFQKILSVLRDAVRQPANPEEQAVVTQS